ncbi:hypothetical protein JCM10908_006585 [Rhodotorula pacifica]|uniref:uncharacterized protein n=1 Tax=Rhodotorula pacifica TaxID=1495444 RepID=UPI003179CFAE
MTRGHEQPIASTSRLPLHPGNGVADHHRFANSPLSGSGPSPSPSSILKPPSATPSSTTDKAQLSRPYYFHFGEKRVKARIDPEVPLAEVVKQLVRSNQLALDAKDAAKPEQYALRERDSGELVSDKNLAEMLQSATYFDLVRSPTYEAQQVVRKLGSPDPATLKQATFSLRALLTDPAFRSAFVRAEGVPALQAIIRRGSGNTLAYALTSLHVLLDTGGNLALDTLFVARLVDIVALEALVNVTRPATAVLCALASNARKNTPNQPATAAYSSFVDILLRQKLLLPALVERLSAGDLELSDLTVDLLDQLLLGSIETADARIPDKLEATEAWRAIAKTLETNVGATVKTFSALQTTLARYLRAASSTPIGEDDYHFFDEIWIASQLKDIDESNRWRRLGFRTEAPQYEFDGVGLLGLKMLKRFAEDSQNEFAETLREDDSAASAPRIPLSTVSNIVFSLLLAHLAPPGEQTVRAPPLSLYLFRFSDCHALAVHFFQRMWEESEPGSRDLERITRMTKSQIAHVLDLQQEKSWFRVRQEFLNANLATVRDRQLRELAADHALLATPKAQALKARLYAEAYDRVSRQRIVALERGAWFRLAPVSPAITGRQVYPRSSESSEAMWRFYRLSLDHRTLHWVDADELSEEKPDLDALPSSVSAKTIVDVRCAEDADATRRPSLEESEYTSGALSSVRRRLSVLQRSAASRSSVDRTDQSDVPFSFALIFSSGAPVQLIAPGAVTYADWVDGLSVLRPDGAIVMKKTLQYVESLADMGTRIKLLDLQDHQQQQPPPPSERRESRGNGH